MKKKVFILAAFCTFSLCIWEAQAINLTTTPLFQYKEDVNMPNGFEEIDLMGDLLYVVGPNAIVAGASDDAVYIGFNEELGNVNISIHSITGNLVYYTVVNTNVQSVVIIPFGGVASGTYTVELSSANGYVDGYFEHE